MADHGGYRAPSKPAAVSGPGAHSQRTDGGLPHQAISAVPDQGYGEAGQQMADQHIAPMGGATPPPTPPSANDIASQSVPQYAGGDFARPSDRPNEPVTEGVPIGPGGNTPAAPSPLPGPAVGAGTGAMSQMLQSLSATDTTGILGQLMQMAQARNA